MGEIFKAIKEYSQFSFFSTPGHKGTLNKLDVTEFPSLEDEHIYDCMNSFPQDKVKEAEARAATLFNVKATRFLTNGASIGIKAAIMAVCGDIIAEEKSHPAVLEGATLANKKVHIIKNRMENGLRQPISLNEISVALAQFKNAGAVVLTSPDYYGLVEDESVFACVKASGKKLIVDSAHGAHFLFSERFPKSPALIADIAILSAHKTLNAYTQSAFLTVNDDSLLSAINKNLKLLGTTSPSYLLLGQLECAINEAANADYNSLFSLINEIKKGISVVTNHDFTRIVLRSSDFKKTDNEMLEFFLSRKIMPEKAGQGFLIFILTPKNSVQDLERLNIALHELI